MFLLQAGEHAAEVLPDEVFEERLGSVAFGKAMFLEELVGEICACFEGEVLGLNERIVAVEKDVFDLLVGARMLAVGCRRRGGRRVAHRHDGFHGLLPPLTFTLGILTVFVYAIGRCRSGRCKSGRCRNGRCEARIVGKLKPKSDRVHG